MNVYSDWRSDKLAIGISALTLLATLAVPFFARAMAGQPWWVNLLIGASILVLGGIAALMRLRLVARSLGGAPNELDEDEPPKENGRTEPTADDDQPTDRWEVVEDSIRKAIIVSGEGPIILLGYAQVDAVGDEEHHKLYYCRLHDVRDAHSYFEYRVKAPWGKLLKRESEVRLLPGEVVHSRRSWSSEDDAGNPNVVADWKGTKEGSRDLVKGSDRMVFVWTDTIQYEKGSTETKTHRLVVPVAGLQDIESKLSEAAGTAMGPTPF